MSKLHDLQCRFRDALLGDDPHLISPLIRHESLIGDRLLSIYRNNVFTNLREALRTLYPVIEKLVGKDFFDYAADEYIRCYPSPAGDLNRFGEQLDVFFSEFEPTAHLPYLPDVAKLEWLVHQVYHAETCDGLAIEKLGTVDPDQYGQLHFSLNPASALLQSAYPVHRIWQVNQTAYNGDPLVELNSGEVKLLIQRHGGLIEIQTLSAGEWVLLTALLTDKDFATACEQALSVDPVMDLTTILVRLVAQATLVDFQIHETELNIVRT
jgi:hypothetical protein